MYNRCAAFRAAAWLVGDRMRGRSRWWKGLAGGLACTLTMGAGASAWGQAGGNRPMPVLKQEQGRATLMVDGQPFFVLGAQVDNSSGWPERLNAVWPAAERLKLNTLEVPVYWEQMEPAKGTFDFSVVDQ